MDVNIYVEGKEQPVLALTKIELASKSGLMFDILRSRADCDCKEPVSVIVTSYDARTVTAALSRFVHFKKKGYSIMPEPEQVPNLLSDLGYEGNFGIAPAIATRDQQNRVVTEEQSGAGEVQDMDTEPATEHGRLARQEKSPRASSVPVPLPARVGAVSPKRNPCPASKTGLQVSQPSQEQSPEGSQSLEVENNDNAVQFEDDRSPINRKVRVKLTRHKGFKKLVVDSCPKNSNRKVKTKNPKPLKNIENEKLKYKTKKFPNLTCRFCSKKFKTKYQLNIHYSRSHFQSQLRKNYIDEESKQCKLCMKEMGKIAYLIDHVGAVHGVVDKLLDKDNDDFRAAAAALENLLEVDENNLENGVKIENVDDEVIILEEISKNKPVPGTNNELINDLLMSDASD